MNRGKGEHSYKQIFKATSIFGGVQVLLILISVIRSKFVAILLGPKGMGIMALLTSTIGLIAGITEFGLATSAVKNVAVASNSEEKDRLAKTVAIFRHLVWITGGLGFVVTLIFAPILSELAFGNKSYTIAFLVLSITLLFTQISNGQMVVLQGMRKVQYLAKASFFGAVAGLIISIPLYYLFNENGIVPAIVITSLTTLLLSWYFAKKVKIPKVTLDKTLYRTEGKDMIKMGFLIGMSSLITIGAGYIVRIFISNIGNMTEVGLFTAGFAIITTYVGMVFTAMGTDYYPRLAEVAHNNAKSRKVINQQAEVAILILSPLLITFLVFVQWGIILLYSKGFLDIVSMVQWAALGIFFKALSWAIAFLFLAKGSSKVYFWNELTANLYVLIFNLIGYYLGGLTGLGISYLCGFILYFIQILFVSQRLYQYRMNKDLIKIFLIHFLTAVLCFLAVQFLEKWLAYSIGMVLIIFSCFYSYKELDKRIGISAIFNRYRK